LKLAPVERSKELAKKIGGLTQTAFDLTPDKLFLHEAPGQKNAHSSPNH
jgi:hypothetical protein